MIKFALPLAFAATVALSSAAFAESNHSYTGTIKAIDAKADTVTLGKTVFHFATGYDLSAFKVGEKVVVTGHVSKKIEVGTKIVAAATPAPAKPAPAKPTTTKTTTKTTAPAKTAPAAKS